MRPSSYPTEHGTDAKHVSLSRNLEAFLSELTAISLRHSIGIAGSPVLYGMEREDFDRKYHVDEQSRLQFS